MIALLAAWRWLLSLPRVLLVCVLAALLIAGGSWFTYHAGQRAGETTVQRHALADSVVTAHTNVERATDSTERKRKLVKKPKEWADSSRQIRKELRAAVEPLLVDLPESVVTLIKHDDNQIRRDSTVITLLVEADSAWLAERRARIEADTLESHQATLGVEPKKSHHARSFVVGAVIGVASVLLLHAVR